MSETKTFGYKIARADTKGKILDVTDSNPTAPLYNREKDGFAPKMVMNLCVYGGEENKASIRHRHHVDLDSLDLLCWDILTGKKGEKREKGYTPLLEEFKGSTVDGVLQSRKLSVYYNDGLNIGPVYCFRFVVCPGVESANGAVMPVKDSKPMIDQTINVSVQEARTIALTIRNYLQAKLVLQLSRVFGKED